MDRQEFPYGRTYFYIRALGLLALSAIVIAFISLQTVTPPEWVALLGIVLVAYVVVVGLSPLLTTHQLLRSRLILRQGWYFRTVIPLEEAKSISPWDGEPKLGLRIGLARRILYAVGSGGNLIAVQLRAPRRFPQVLFLRAAEIVFDVDDRDRFLAAVKERRATGPALPPRKVPMLPAVRR